VATWGGGAACAAAAGFVQVRLPPLRVAQARAWLVSEALPLGRWLGLTIAVFAASQQGVVVIVAAILGADDVGGLRAGQVVFAPASLVFPAIGLPALPALTRTAARSLRAARVAAGWYSLAAAGLVFAYMVPALLLRDDLLSWLFGPSFLRFRDLVIPLGAGQLALTAGLGYSVLLRVMRRGRALLACEAISAVSTILLVIALSKADGVNGAAWAIAAGVALGTLPIIVLAYLPGSDASASTQGRGIGASHGDAHAESDEGPEPDGDLGALQGGIEESVHQDRGHSGHHDREDGAPGPVGGAS
jgi:O-antigen/teichoic acid export membrane protein